MTGSIFNGFDPTIPANNIVRFTTQGGGLRDGNDNDGWKDSIARQDSGSGVTQRTEAGPPRQIGPGLNHTMNLAE
jgi:hypothetical protein